MKNKLFATVAIAALALSGCSDSTGAADEPTADTTVETTNSATATESETDGPSLHGTYNSVDELKAAVEDAGYACNAPEELGWNQISCDGVDVLAVFANPGSASAYVHKAEATAEKAFAVLAGDNWIVNGEEADLEQLQAELGGEVQTYEAAPVEDEDAS